MRLLPFKNRMPLCPPSILFFKLSLPTLFCFGAWTSRRRAARGVLASFSWGSFSIFFSIFGLVARAFHSTFSTSAANLMQEAITGATATIIYGLRIHCIYRPLVVALRTSCYIARHFHFLACHTLLFHMCSFSFFKASSFHKIPKTRKKKHKQRVQK